MTTENVKIAPKAKKPKVKQFDTPPSFDTKDEAKHLMESEGLFVGLNMPKAISAKNDDENALPPYRKRQFFSVDEFPACPSNWVPSRGKMRSYFVPVIAGEGMWLDFNKNLANSHHVAVVVSIQGVNAVTGLMTSDEHLEQYVEKCPKHDTAFGPKRWCEKCGYHWPKQNYICSTATPNGSFWLDGFRAADGAVRQYLLTAEKMRGVASNIIGEERVFAIGLAFFLSKNPKPQPQYQPLMRSFPIDGGILGTNKKMSMLPTWTTDTNDLYFSKGVKNHEYSLTTTDWMPNEVSIQCCSSVDDIDASSLMELERGIQTMGVSVKNLEIGAGARIRQQIHDDKESLDFWRPDPSAIICVNYCLEEDARAIMAGGRLDLSGSSEGFMQGVPVGN
jgi:hypothetical protein